MPGRSGKLEEALACFRQVHDLRARLATGEHAGPPERLELAGSDYNLACCYALFAAAIRKDDKRPAVLRSEEGEKLAREAMQSLRRAKANGYFAVPANRKQLDKDTDLDSLRTRADYKAFLATLPKSH